MAIFGVDRRPAVLEPKQHVYAARRRSPDVDGDRGRIKVLAIDGQLILNEVEQVAAGPCEQPSTSDADGTLGPSEQEIESRLRRGGRL
jgi:hypothetical protein